MIFHDVEQGSPEWFEVRAGLPTASEFHRIVQPGGEVRYKKNGDPYKSRAGDLSEGRWAYACELAAERLLGECKTPLEGLQWLERGKLMEPMAVAHYEFTRERKTAKVGFITPDHGMWGCSPDRLVIGTDGDPVGALEIKCPSPARHIGYLINGPGTDYRCQVQGSLLITGFDYWDFLSYDPRMPDVLIRFERDEPFIEKLKAGLAQFSDEVNWITEKVKAAGYVPTPAKFVPPADMAMQAWEGSSAINAILKAGNMGG